MWEAGGRRRPKAQAQAQDVGGKEVGVISGETIDPRTTAEARPVWWEACPVFAPDPDETEICARCGWLLVDHTLGDAARSDRGALDAAA